jgi:DNA polymerase
MLNTSEGIMRLRGKWKTYETAGRSIRAMATLHPAYLLRNPSAKRHAWRDLLTVKTALTNQ